MNNKPINGRTRLSLKNIDIDYCFLGDVGCGEFTDNSYSVNKIGKKFINNNPYKDPDNNSNLLYKYHAFLWEFLNHSNDKHCSRTKHDWKQITYIFNEEVYYLTSDYIGISTYWAIKKQISDSILNDYLLVARTIGGHILFWRHSKEDYDCWFENKKAFVFISKDEKNFNGYKKITINTARGGKNGLFDRFDWTLIFLKEYYKYINKEFSDRQNLFLNSEYALDLSNYENLSNEESNLKYNPKYTVMRMFYAFENSREWLLTYNSFCEFISFFKLESFINGDGQIIELSPLFPVLPADYKSYINNSKILIIKRLDQIKQLI